MHHWHRPSEAIRDQLSDMHQIRPIASRTASPGRPGPRRKSDSVSCGSLWAFNVKVPGTENFRGSQSDNVFTAEIRPVGTDVKGVDVLLTPNARLIDMQPYVNEFWGDKILLKDVPLRRLDTRGREENPMSSSQKHAMPE